MKAGVGVLILAVALLVSSIDTTNKIEHVEDEQVQAIVHKDGSAQIIIGDVVCGLPPIGNEVAKARCHER